MNNSRLTTATDETRAVLGAHDNLCQLGSVLTQLKCAADANDIDQIQQVLGDAEILVGEALNDLQQIVPIKIETQPEEPTGIDLNILVGKTIHALSQEIPRASDITFNLGSLPKVYGDKTQLLRLVQEVLLNTGLEDENDQTNIVVTTQTTANFACITIRDDGPEMTDDEITEFLNPCAENSDAYAPCQAIVESHNGRIKVISNPEDGTCVDIFLPIKS